MEIPKREKYLSDIESLVALATGRLWRRVQVYVGRTKMPWGDAHELFSWPIEHYTRALRRLSADHYEVYVPRRRGVDQTGLVLSVPLVRYLAEMTANICFMIAAPNDETRSVRLVEWRNSRSAIGGSLQGRDWPILVDKLPKRARDKVKQSTLVNTPHHGELNLSRIGAEDVRFEDIFGSNFFRKAQAIPLSDRDLFEERYKMWTYISKANAYSLLPASLTLVHPLNEAIQLFAAYGKCCSNFLGREAFPSGVIDEVKKLEAVVRGELQS